MPSGDAPPATRGRAVRRRGRRPAAPAAPAGRAPGSSRRRRLRPSPTRPYVAAAKRRKQIPFWAMPVLALLPLWAFIYWHSVQPPPAGRERPAGRSAPQVYAATAPAATAPTAAAVAAPAARRRRGAQDLPGPLDQIHWVALGATSGGPDADGTYGDPQPARCGSRTRRQLSTGAIAQVALYEQGSSAARPASDADRAPSRSADEREDPVQEASHGTLSPRARRSTTAKVAAGLTPERLVPAAPSSARRPGWSG